MRVEDRVRINWWC